METKGSEQIPGACGVGTGRAGGWVWGGLWTQWWKMVPEGIMVYRGEPETDLAGEIGCFL